MDYNSWFLRIKVTEIFLKMLWDNNVKDYTSEPEETNFYLVLVNLKTLEITDLILCWKHRKIVVFSGHRGSLPFQENQSSYMRCDDDNFPFVDYDAYDAQVFKLPSSRATT